jgi:zinc/manganese transport system permease protein
MFDEHTLGRMLQALSICLVLTGIHGYLGIHVLERKVIFVDLAMGQIAALGATWALFLGYVPHEHPLAVYLFSLFFTLAGAAVFSLTRMRHEKIPHEAIIGIIYATASSIAILILAKSASAGEQIRGMLVRDILLAGWRDVGVTAAIYAGVGAFHWRYRERFLKISMDPEGAYAAGVNVRLWDFLFYATFGVVITSSVAIAGVLLVFTFLVVPACIGVLFAERPGRRVGVAWGAGTGVSVLAVWFTFFEGSLPAGPVVVAAFALALAASAVVRALKGAARLGPTLAKLGAGTAAVALVAAGSYLLRNPSPRDDHADHPTEFELHLQELRSADENQQLHAIDHFAAAPDAHAVPELLALLERTSSTRVVEHLAVALARSGDARAAPALRKAAERPGLDPPLRLALAEAVVELKDPAGLGFLLPLAADEAAPRLSRVKALRLFEKKTGKSFGYEIGGDARRLEQMRQWWAEHGSHLRWREATGRFE